jgi:hypothetical protein
MLGLLGLSTIARRPPPATFAERPRFVLSSAAVAPEGQTDPAAIEARIFARYLVGRVPPPDLVQRYRDASRTIWGSDDGAAAEDPLVVFARRHPWTVGPLDAATSVLRPGGVLHAKVLTMAAILEASPAFADDFLPRNVSRGALLWQLVVGGAAASLQALVGLVLIPLARRART